MYHFLQNKLDTLLDHRATNLGDRIKSRIHFFEWEDQPWFPELFRSFITDHLVFHARRLFLPLAPKLSETLKTTGNTKIVDLCSGSGGPLPVLLSECSDTLNLKVTATLTDLYPNIETLEQTKVKSDGAIDYQAESINAMNCPDSLKGMRTLFTALHHFRPDDAKKILADAVNKRVAIGAFEIQERNIFKLLITPIIIFLSAFILTPFVGRMTFSRFVFTYLIPLMPFFYTWDGVVSCLRTYYPKELDELTIGLHCEGYRWESGKIPATGYIGPYNITYLIGVPVNPSTKKATKEAT